MEELIAKNDNEIVVNLQTVEKVKSFVQEMSSIGAKLDVIRGRYIIDGTSLLGLLSLDLSKPLLIVIQNVEYVSIKDALKKYI